MSIVFIHGQLGASKARQHMPMNLAHKNLKFLIGDMSANALAKQAGTNQTTISRGLRKVDWDPDRVIAEKVAKVFRITPHEFLYVDLEERAKSAAGESIRPLKGGLVHIRQLDGFQIPSGTPLSRHDVFDDVLVVKDEWFQFNVGIDPKDARYAIQRDDSLRGDINLGAVVIFDTSANDVHELGEGIYAFTYFGINHIKLIQIPRRGTLLFAGTNRNLNAIMVEGKELEGLKVHGRAMLTLHGKRL